MRFSGIALCIATAAALAASAAQAGGGYGGYGHDGYPFGYGWYEPGPVTNGYYGRPRFFRGWHDSVSGYDDPYNFSDYYPYGSAGYLPDAIGPYQDNRGYGVEGRGWQLP